MCFNWKSYIKEHCSWVFYHFDNITFVVVSRHLQSTSEIRTVRFYRIQFLSGCSDIRMVRYSKGPVFRWQFENWTHLSGFRMVKIRPLYKKRVIKNICFMTKQSSLVLFCCPDPFVRFSNAKWLANNSKTRQFVRFLNG